jgi:hypothetical protein
MPGDADEGVRIDVHEFHVVSGWSLGVEGQVLLSR